MLKFRIKTLKFNILAAALFMSVANNAHAIDKLYKPQVDKGVLEMGVTTEHRTDGALQIIDNFTEVETDLSYGFTDSLGFGVELGGDKFDGSDFEYTVTGIESTFQFSETDGSSPVAVGLRTEYEVSHVGADSVNAALLFDYVGDKFEFLINAGVSSEVGSKANQDISGDIRVGARYLYSPLLQPGVEYYSNTGELEDFNDLEDQTSTIGPVLTGNLTNSLYYEAGYLYGISDDAPDNSYKLGLSYKVDFDDLRSFDPDKQN